MEAIGHNAATLTGEAAGRGNALTGRTGDSEGSVPFAAKADTGIGRGILDKDRGFNSAGKTAEVINVLGMHMGGVAVTVRNDELAIDSL